jgi:lysozyme family protein
MRNNFKRSLAAILKEEGGLVHHPKDPGGLTNFGVTDRVYQSWLKNNGKPPRSVKDITMAEVEIIYYQQYWVMVRGDLLPAGLDLAVCDFAINSGVSRAAKMLQQVLGVKADGIIGNVTLAAANEQPAPQVIEQLCDARLAFVRSLGTWKVFGNGWLRRIGRIREEALAMAGETAPPSELPPKPLPMPMPPMPKGKATIGEVMLWVVGALFMGFLAWIGFGR